VDWAFPWYIGAAFFVAIAGGFLLAMLLPLAVLEGWDWGLRWEPLVQAHGHLQTLGWLGLFLIGMADRLIPRFAGRPLRFARVTPVALVLLLAGLLGRTAAQPWLDRPGLHEVLVVSAFAELLGAVLFAGAVLLTLAPALRTLPVAPLFLLGALGLLGQAVLGAIWLPVLTPDSPVIAPVRDSVLLGLQFYAFILPFVLGVSLRALPAFFKHRAPATAEVWVLSGLLLLGSLFYAGSALWGGGSAQAGFESIGALLLAVAMLGAALETGIWRKPEGLRVSARHAVLLIRSAYIWMLLAAALLAIGGASALLTHQPAPPYLADAVRHMLALGMFSTMIAGMAQLLFPSLAQRRLKSRDAIMQTWVLWSLFMLAVTLRASGALLEGVGADGERYWLITAGGVAGISAVGFLGATILRSTRRQSGVLPLHEADRP